MSGPGYGKLSINLKRIETLLGLSKYRKRNSI
jgi:hypothetical protein